MENITNFRFRLMQTLFVVKFAIAACLAPLAATAQTLAVRFGQLVLGTGETIRDGVVRIEGRESAVSARVILRCLQTPVSSICDR